MKIVTTKQQLASSLNEIKAKGLSIGFVPTMGALHKGHISLVFVSKKQADVTVCSIFVNPTQFNNQDDLINYPKPIDTDIEKLEAASCDILFYPEIDEMYESDEVWDYEVGALDKKLEGEFRPGHYKGVTQIVHKLFAAVKPDIAFFGQKDYQQFLVIQKMVSDFQLPVRLTLCDTVREEDGLAMSSRNIRLNREERDIATVLFKALSFVRENYDKLSILELTQKGKAFFERQELLNLEYFKICDKETLEEANEKPENGAIVLVACLVGSTRLIDNMILS